MWYAFDCSLPSISSFMDLRSSRGGEFTIELDVQIKPPFAIKNGGEWLARSAERDFTTASQTRDAYAVLFQDHDGQDIWWLSSIDGFLHSPHGI